MLVLSIKPVSLAVFRLEEYHKISIMVVLQKFNFVLYNLQINHNKKICLYNWMNIVNTVTVLCYNLPLPVAYCNFLL